MKKKNIFFSFSDKDCTEIDWFIKQTTLNVNEFRSNWHKTWVASYLPGGFLAWKQTKKSKRRNFKQGLPTSWRVVANAVQHLYGQTVITPQTNIHSTFLFFSWEINTNCVHNLEKTGPVWLTPHHQRLCNTSTVQSQKTWCHFWNYAHFGRTRREHQWEITKLQ